MGGELKWACVLSRTIGDFPIEFSVQIISAMITNSLYFQFEVVFRLDRNLHLGINLLNSHATTLRMKSMSIQTFMNRNE